MTVLAGGVVATLAVTGVVGTPLSFLILAIVLALFAVGYAAMSRHVVNAGVFYAYISQGLGGAWGVAASFVALVSYNAIQIGLYGLFGAAAGGFLDAKPGLNWTWEAWALHRDGGRRDPRPAPRRPERRRCWPSCWSLEVAAVLLFDVGQLRAPGRRLDQLRRPQPEQAVRLRASASSSRSASPRSPASSPPATTPKRRRTRSARSPSR